MSLFALKCPSMKAMPASVILIFPFECGRLPALLLLLPALCWFCGTSFNQGGRIQKRMHLHSGQITVNICANRSCFLGGRSKCGTPLCPKQVSIVVSVQIGRCYLEPKALSLLHQPCCYIPLRPTPILALVLEQLIQPSAKTCVEQRMGVFLVCSVLHHDDPQQRCSYVCFIRLFSAFPLASVRIPKFLVRERQIKWETTSLCVRIYLIRQ